METDQPGSRLHFTIRALFVAVLAVACYCGGWSHAKSQYGTELVIYKERALAAEAQLTKISRNLQDLNLGYSALLRHAENLQDRADKAEKRNPN